MSDLFTPPKWFREVTFVRHTNRSITWLELFYDLVYVATFIQIGNFLSDNLTLLGFGQFLVLTTVVWWSWTGETFYQNRFYADDLIHRGLIFIQIFAVALMGLTVSKAFGDLYIQFTLAYVLTRFTLVLMYIRALRAYPNNSQYQKGFIGGFGIGIAIWLASLLLPAEFHWVGWLIGITFELLVPLRPSMQAEARAWGIDQHHISERFGIFTIIVLGESFVKILEDSQGTAFGAAQFMFGIGGFVVLYSLWWLYFSDTGDKSADFTGPFPKIVAWVYSHLPLSAGLIAFGVGAKKLYASTLKYADEPVTPEYRLLYTAAIVLYLLALTAIDYGIDEGNSITIRIQEFAHLIGAVLIAIIGLTMTNATPTAYVSMVALVMAVQVVLSIIETRKEGTAAAHN